MKDLVSVIMGVHEENPEFLAVAIDSIVNQSYGNLEFIIIDDAASAECKALLSKYESKFDSIRIIRNPENIGLTKSLNKGLKIARGIFIARMDADDYSVPSRIEKQVKFLEENPDIELCGTGVISFGDNNFFMSPYDGMDNDAAQCCLFFSSTLCHPSVMIRKSFLERYSLRYDETILRGQDYDLWERCSVCGHLAVLDEVLLYYRAHSRQITSEHRNEQDDSANSVRLRRLSRLGILPSETERKCHSLLAGGKDNSVSVKDMKDWVNKLLDSNVRISLLNQDAFKEDLKTRLVMYKVRNGKILSLMNAYDIPLLFRVISSRLNARNKLRKSNKLLNRLLYRELD